MQTEPLPLPTRRSRLPFHIALHSRRFLAAFVVAGLVAYAVAAVLLPVATVRTIVIYCTIAAALAALVLTLTGTFRSLVDRRPLEAGNVLLVGVFLLLVGVIADAITRYFVISALASEGGLTAAYITDAEFVVRNFARWFIALGAVVITLALIPVRR